MFDPNSLAKMKSDAEIRKRALANLTEWSMELVPENLRKNLVLDVRDVQCGDPNCAPVDTLFLFLWGGSEFQQGKGRFGLPLAPEELQSKDELQSHFPDEETLRAWSSGDLSEKEKKRQEQLKAGAIRQTCLDQIHHFSLWADAVVHHVDASALTRKVCVSLLRNLSETSVELFSSKGEKAKELLGEDLRLASQVLSRVCNKDSLGSLFVKFSIDQDPQSPMKLWRDKVMQELEEVYSCRTLSVSKKEMLRTALTYVRQVEKSWEFQLELWDMKTDTMEKYGVSTKESLTYGTTSFSLWRDVMALPLVREALHPAKKPKVAVLGSSQGLLCLYTDALCNSFVKNTGGDSVLIEGWEIQECLHGIAEDLLESVSGDTNNVRVHMADMFTADLSRFNVVVLTSLCWDNETRLKIAQKCARELEVGSLVIDYQEGTFKDFDLDTTSNLYGRTTGGNGGDGKTSTKGGKEGAVTPPSVTEASIGQLTRALDNALADAIEAYWNGDELLVPPAPEKKVHMAEEAREKTGGRFKVESLAEGACSWSNKQTLYIHRKKK